MTERGESTEPRHNLVKVSVLLPEGDIATLVNSAKKRGLTLTEAFIRVIHQLDFIERAVENGERFLIEERRGRVRYLNIR